MLDNMLKTLSNHGILVRILGQRLWIGNSSSKDVRRDRGKADFLAIHDLERMIIGEAPVQAQTV